MSDEMKVYVNLEDVRIIKRSANGLEGVGHYSISAAGLHMSGMTGRLYGKTEAEIYEKASEAAQDFVNCLMMSDL